MSRYICVTGAAMTPLEAFYKYVFKTDTCWLWTGGTMSTGYGMFSASKLGIKSKLAHRWHYEHVVGQIPRELVIDHLCDNRKCVNIAHMRVATHRENILRGTGYTAREANKTHCDSGHEFTPENTRISPRGWRICRACKRVKSKRDYNKNIARSRANACVRAQRYRDKIKCQST